MSAFLILAIALMALLASGYALRINISMKSIVVFGATGKTGKEAVYQSLQKGYKVIALARDPSKLQYPRGSAGDKEEKIIADPNLTVIKGSATDPASVRLVFDVSDHQYCKENHSNTYLF